MSYGIASLGMALVNPSWAPCDTSSYRRAGISGATLMQYRCQLHEGLTDVHLVSVSVKKRLLWRSQPKKAVRSLRVWIRFNKITVWPLTWHWLQSWECTECTPIAQTKINDFANEHTNCCSRFRICQWNGFASTLHYTTRYGPQLMASSQITDYSLGDEMENEWKKQPHPKSFYEVDRDAWNGVRCNGASELVERTQLCKRHKQITENYVNFCAIVFSAEHVMIAL